MDGRTVFVGDHDLVEDGDTISFTTRAFGEALYAHDIEVIEPAPKTFLGSVADLVRDPQTWASLRDLSPIR